MDGIGVYEWPDGRKYMGQYSLNVKSGYGIYIYKDNRVYIGNFENG